MPSVCSAYGRPGLPAAQAARHVIEAAAEFDDSTRLAVVSMR